MTWFAFVCQVWLYIVSFALWIGELFALAIFPLTATPCDCCLAGLPLVAVPDLG